VDTIVAVHIASLTCDYTLVQTVRGGRLPCGTCSVKFNIGPNMIFGSRLTDAQAAKQFEAMLAEDHKANRPHQDAYEIRDTRSLCP